MDGVGAIGDEADDLIDPPMSPSSTTPSPPAALPPRDDSKEVVDAKVSEDGEPTVAANSHSHNHGQACSTRCFILRMVVSSSLAHRRCSSTNVSARFALRPAERGHCDTLRGTCSPASRIGCGHLKQQTKRAKVRRSDEFARRCGRLSAEQRRARAERIHAGYPRLTATTGFQPIEHEDRTDSSKLGPERRKRAGAGETPSGGVSSID